MPAPVECPLCNARSETLIWQTASCRVILVHEANYPGYCCVIWKAHVSEMTDLTPSERTLLLDAVWATETALRDLLQPDKINLASLGNMVPHLHWHVIPRFRDDTHYPQAIWSTPQRDAAQHSGLDPDVLAQRIAAAMKHLSTASSDNQ